MHHDSELKGGCGGGGGGGLDVWQFGYVLRDHGFDPLCITYLSVVLNPKSAQLLNIHAFGMSVSYMQNFNTSPSVTRSLGLSVLNKLPVSLSVKHHKWHVHILCVLHVSESWQITQFVINNLKVSQVKLSIKTFCESGVEW